MRNKTLWETICDRAGRDGRAAINVAEAVSASAVTEGIGEVEIRRFTEDGLIVQLDDQTVQLTDSGRNSCGHIHRSPASVTDPSIDAASPETPER